MYRSAGVAAGKNILPISISKHVASIQSQHATIIYVPLTNMAKSELPVCYVCTTIDAW